MHITLHLTTACNLNCTYCYSHPTDSVFEMSEEIIDKSIEFSMNEFSTNIGIIFFGGEPLLRKDLIEYTIKKCNRIEEEKNYNMHFHFKVTTNGTLIDEDFLIFCKINGLKIGLSIDGVQKAHDRNRRFSNGNGSFNIIDGKLNKLLKYQPYANALMVVSPENLDYFAESVEFLVSSGFKYIISSLNYAGNWSDIHINELRKQYKKIAKLYKKWTIENKKFYFSPFEMKFANYIRGNESNIYSCQLSKKQISVAPDGKIYPCVQFVKDGISNSDYSIGDVSNGFNNKRELLYIESIVQNKSCTECAYKNRCYNTCSCLNWQTTGFINSISPVLCESERVLIPIVDKLGEELFRKKYPMFIQKHYNLSYPLLSMMEDELNK